MSLKVSVCKSVSTSNSAHHVHCREQVPGKCSYGEGEVNYIFNTTGGFTACSFKSTTILSIPKWVIGVENIP